MMYQSIEFGTLRWRRSVMRGRSSLAVVSPSLPVPSPTISLKGLAFMLIVQLGIVKPMIGRVKRLDFLGFLFQAVFDVVLNRSPGFSVSLEHASSLESSKRLLLPFRQLYGFLLCLGIYNCLLGSLLLSSSRQRALFLREPFSNHGGSGLVVTGSAEFDDIVRIRKEVSPSNLPGMVLADDVVPIRRALLPADATGTSLCRKCHEAPSTSPRINLPYLDPLEKATCSVVLEGSRREPNPGRPRESIGKYFPNSFCQLRCELQDLKETPPKLYGHPCTNGKTSQNQDDPDVEKRIFKLIGKPLAKSLGESNPTITDTHIRRRGYFA